MAKTYHSLKEFGLAQGIKEREPRPERARKCRLCGADMVHFAGTNVWFCTNEVTRKKKVKDRETGAEKEVEVTETCGKTILGKVS